MSLIQYKLGQYYIAITIILICCTSPITVLCQSSPRAKIDSLYRLASDPSVHDTIRFQTYYRLSEFYENISMDTADIMNEYALEFAKKYRSPIDLSKAYSRKAVILSRHNLLDSSLFYLDRARALLEEKDDYFTHKQLLLRYGIHYHHQGDFEKVLAYNDEALAYIKPDDHEYLGLLYYNRAIVFIIQELNEPAKKYFSLAYKHSKLAEDLNSEIGAIKGIVHILAYVEGKFDSLDTYLERSDQICLKTQSNDLCLDAKLMAARAYDKEGDLKKSKPYYHSALHYSRKFNSDYTLLSVLANCADIDSRIKDYKEARQHFVEFDSLFRDSKSYELGDPLYLTWAKMEEDLGNYKASILLHKKHAAIIDSLQKRDNVQALANAEEKYQSVQKEAELLAQNLLLARRQKKISYLTSGLIFSALGMILFYGFFQNSKRKNQLVHQELELKSMALEAAEKEKSILALSASLEGQEAERLRIAKDLHDGLGGLLSTVKAHYNNIGNEIEKIDNLDIYQKANELMDEACEEVRRISHNMMPGALRLEGLKVALEHYVDQLNMAHSFETKLEIIGVSDNRIDERKELFIYRIIQELSNNIIKYAQAKNILIQLTKTAEGIDIIVEDDGVGFDPESIDKSKGLGLRSIQSRVEHLNGYWDIDSRIGEGTAVSVTIPDM